MFEHSSIRTTVDLYHHWIEETECGNTFEVDRLTESPSSGAVS